MEFFIGLGIFLFPALLLLCGLFMWIAGRPQRINWLAGYRTPRATKNQDTWVFANRYFGKLSMLSGLITLTFSIGVFLHAEDMYIVPWALGAQGVALIFTFLFTEITLKNEFDKNGNRKR